MCAASCVDHTVDGMLSPIRHERSHIMYWNRGRNRLMSLSNVSRDGRAQSPSLPWIQLSKSAPEYFCDVRSVEIANWYWLQESRDMCVSVQTNADTRG